MSDRKAAAEKLLRRQKMRASVVEFARACGYEPQVHHRYIISFLERIAAGKLHRWLCAAPPGSAKSSYASAVRCTGRLMVTRKRTALVWHDCDDGRQFLVFGAVSRMTQSIEAIEKNDAR
jgi:hypothetical protein